MPFRASPTFFAPSPFLPVSLHGRVCMKRALAAMASYDTGWLSLRQSFVRKQADYDRSHLRFVKLQSSRYKITTVSCHTLQLVPPSSLIVELRAYNSSRNTADPIISRSNHHDFTQPNPQHERERSIFFQLHCQLI